MDYSNADSYRRILIVEGASSWREASDAAGHEKLAKADLVICLDDDASLVTKDRYGRQRNLTPEEVFDLRQLETTEIVTA